MSKKSTEFLAPWVLVLAVLLPLRNATAQSHPRPMGLDDAISRALRTSSHVHQAEAQREAAEAAAGPLASAYMPSASLSASSLYSQYPMTVTPIREQGIFPPLDEQVNELSLNVSWTVFDFGRGRAERKSALALADAANLQYDLARMETVERITAGYVRLAQLRDVQRAQEERRLALLERQTQLIALHDEGRVPDVELLRIAEVLLTAETDQLKTRNDISAVLIDLSVELDLADVLKPHDVELFELGSSAPKAPELDADAVSSPLIDVGSPLIEQANLRLEAARFAVREADRSLLPAFEVFGAERLRSGADFSFDDELYGGIRVTVPLFQPLRTVRRQVERATLNQREAELASAEREVAAASRNLANRAIEALERVAAMEARIDHLDETYRIEAAAFEEGRLTFSDLLDTEARLAAARSELAAARAESILIQLNRNVLEGSLTQARALYLAGIQQ